MVANVPAQEVLWDHPDRETNPLASAPSNVIFSRVSIEENRELHLTGHIQENPPQPEEPISNYLNLYKAESEKNVILMNENRELRNILEQMRIGANRKESLENGDRRRFEELIDDLRKQNERLSLMLKKKPVQSVVENRVVGER